MREGKVHGERAEGLPTCLPPVLKNVEYWWEMLLHFHHFWAFAPLWMRMWWDEESSRWEPGLCGCHPGCRAVTGHGLARWATHLHLPSQALAHGWAKCPEILALPGCEGKAAYSKIRVLCVCKSCSVNSNPTPSIGSLPKQQSVRSIKGPYILHVIPCLNPSQPGPVNISLLLSCKGPRRAAGCGGSPCCPDRGQPPFRTCNTHSEGLLWEKVNVHPCSYKDPCYLTPQWQHPKLYPHERLYCSKPVPLVPLVLCFILLRQWLSFSLSDCWNNSRVLASVRGLQ